MHNMARPFKCRQIWRNPNFVYFKPRAVPLSSLREVILTVDEAETLRLKDLEKLNQIEAAEKMNIHQSTFQRTLTRAREKVSDAIINGKAIKIHGGNYKMPGGDRTGPLGQGPFTGRRGGGGGAGRGLGRGQGFGAPPANCVCPNCGYQEAKKPGVLCSSLVCPKCNTRMVRG